MRNLNPMTLVMVAWLASAGTAVRVAPAQSAPPESGKSNSTTATTNSKTTKVQSAQPQSASRWTAGGNTPGNGGASSWGPTLKSSETEPGMGSAGAEGFGSTIQPGGIWRSTQTPSADENAALPGPPRTGTDMAPGADKKTSTPMETAGRSSTSGPPSSSVGESGPFGAGHPASSGLLETTPRARTGRPTSAYAYSGGQSSAPFGTGALSRRTSGRGIHGQIGHAGGLRNSRSNGRRGHGGRGRIRSGNRSQTGQQPQSDSGRYSVGLGQGGMDRGSGGRASAGGTQSGGKQVNGHREGSHPASSGNPHSGSRAEDKVNRSH